MKESKLYKIAVKLGNELTFFTALTAFALPFVAAADDVKFTPTQTVGDLASTDPSDWNGTAPANTDRVLFSAASGSLAATALSDIAFAGFYLNKANQTVTLDMRDETTGASPRTIDLTGGSISWGSVGYQTLNIRGGRWEMPGRTLYARADLYNENNKHPTINITDGAVINMGTLKGGYGNDSYALIHVAGAETVVTASTVTVAWIDAYGDRIEITDGAKVVATNRTSGSNVIVVDNCTANGNFSRNCGLVVSGAGSSLRTVGYNPVVVGYRAFGNYIHVLDGAAFDFGGILYFGYLSSLANSNTVRVAGNGSSLNMGTCYIGRTIGSSRNTGNILEVLDGGTVVGSGRLFFGGNGNGIVVSNATVEIAGGGMSESVAQDIVGTNCFIRLQGETPSFVTTQQPSDTYMNTLYHSFTLIYDLPENGYPVNHVPVRFEYISRTDSSLTVKINGLERVRQRMAETKKYKLSMTLLADADAANRVGWNTNEGITSAMIDRWNADLPRYAKVSRANGVLTLTVKRPQFIVSFK